MGIEDFLIEYPTPSNKNFRDDLLSKQELYNMRLVEPDESFEQDPNKVGDWFKYQRSNAMLSTQITKFDKRLIWHRMGLGKTRTAIRSIEEYFKHAQLVNIKPKRVLVLLSGENLIRKFKEEIITTYPELYEIDESTSEQRKNKLLGKKYAFSTYQIFAKRYAEAKQLYNQLYSYSMIVCDEIHTLIRTDEDTEADKSTRDTIHEFLHNIIGTKIIFMSGTPMRNSWDEIISMMNLLLPLDKQINATDTSFFDKNNKLTDQGKSKLKSMFGSYVSFLKAKTNIKYTFEHVPNSKYNFKFLKLKYDVMGDKQFEYYKARTGDGSFESGTTDASSFGAPASEIIVSEGQKLVIPKLTDKFLRQFTDDMTISEKLDKLAEYSTKFASTIRYYYEHPDDVAFFYSERVKFPGVLLFASILQNIFKFKESRGTKINKIAEGSEVTLDKYTRDIRFQYVLITSEDSPLDIYRKLGLVKTVDNIRGDVVKVVIASKLLSTGYDIGNVKRGDIITSHWNYAQIEQAMSRILRYNGNKLLKENGINTDVNIALHAAIFPGDIRTIDIEGRQHPPVDIHKYMICEEKDYKIKQIERIAKQVAWDCPINYCMNLPDIAEKNSRECDYQDCIFKCDNVVANGSDPQTMYERDESQLVLNNYRNMYVDDELNEKIDDTMYFYTISEKCGKKKFDENLYTNTKIMYLYGNNSNYAFSRVGFCGFIGSDNNTFYIQMSSSTTKNIPSWYSTFPMYTVTTPIEEVLQHSNITKVYVDNINNKIEKCKTVERCSELLHKLPTWIFRQKIMKLFLDIFQDDIFEHADNWNRTNIINVSKELKCEKITRAVFEDIYVYPKLLLLNIKGVLWRLVEGKTWVLQTGAQTDDTIKNYDKVFADKVGETTKVYGKVQNDDYHTLKLVNTLNVKSRGQDYKTIELYIIIYLACVYNIIPDKTELSIDKKSIKTIKNNEIYSQILKTFKINITDDEYVDYAYYWLNVSKNPRTELQEHIYNKLDDDEYIQHI